jgi:hypothetical protein
VGIVSPTIAQRTCSDQCLSFGPEPLLSGGVPQFGRICAIEYATKAGLRRRSCRRVNMMARRNPVRAPRHPSVIERLLKVRRPWPVRRNPVYAKATVQRIARTFMGPHTSGISGPRTAFLRRSPTLKAIRCIRNCQKLQGASLAHSGTPGRIADRGQTSQFLSCRKSLAGCDR